MPIVYTTEKECEKIIVALTEKYGIGDVDTSKIINRITKCMMLQSRDENVRRKAQQQYKYKPKPKKKMEQLELKEILPDEQNSVNDSEE